MQEIRDWRRHIHRNAELSFEEYNTQSFIMSILDHYHIANRKVAGTGVLASVGDVSGDVVVLRADIDALPIDETSGVEFTSSRPGVMHACGHDMHAAALLGAIVELSQKPPLDRGVVALFQPGEELHPGGASVVLKDGVLNQYKVKYIVGQHCSPELACGTFGFCGGQFMASTDEIHITFKGRGGHAAQPELLRNPIWAAVDFLSAARDIAPIDGTRHVLAFGRVVADGATNVIPNEVYVEGTFRTFSEAWRGKCKEVLRELAQRIETESGVVVEIEIKDGYPSVFNDNELTQRAMEMANATFGQGSAIAVPQRMTAEDFGFYSERYRALFYRLGVGYADKEAGRLHTGAFCPNEDALEFGAKFLALLATI